MDKRMLISSAINRVHSIRPISAIPSELPGMYWDITYRCNLRCHHCLNNGGDCSKNPVSEELTCEEAESVINQISIFRPPSLCICGGEPLLRYDLVVAILNAMNKVNIPVNMVSNGLLVNDAICAELKVLKVNSVQISLDGLGWQHDKFRNQVGSFEIAVAAVETLKKHKIDTVISFCPNKYNYYSFSQFVDFVKDLRCNTIRMMPLTPLGRAKENYEEFRLTEAEQFYFVQTIHQKKVEYPNMNIDWGDPLDYVNKALVNRKASPTVIGFLANGDITVTPYLNLSIGNIKKHTLMEYWDGGLNRAYEIPIILDVLKRSRSLEDIMNAQRIHIDLLGENENNAHRNSSTCI